MNDLLRLIPSDNPKREKIVKVFDVLTQAIADDIKNQDVSSVHLPGFISIQYIPKWGDRLRTRWRHNVNRGVLTEDDFEKLCEKQDKLTFKQHGNRKHNYFT